MYSTILIGIRRIVIRTDVLSNISKNTLFSYKENIAINKNDTTNKISIIIADIKNIYLLYLTYMYYSINLGLLTHSDILRNT